MTTQPKFRQAHVDLLASYEEIREEFADLDDQTLARFLGKYNSAQLRQQVREHGDGYTIRSVPSHVEEILLADVLVLIAMNSPKLDNNSVFSPYSPLTDIHYWSEYRCLRPEAYLQNGDLVKFQFFVWEQDCAVHGEVNKRGESTSNARKNQRFLFNQRPRLRELHSLQEEMSEGFLSSCKEWLRSRDRKLVVLTNQKRVNFPSPIDELRGDETALHIPTKLFGLNVNIMNEIISKIPE